MARGWDLGGARGYDASSWRLLCADPPGPGGAGIVRPNVFCGLTPWDNTPPAVNLGVGNFSIEAWFCWKLHVNVVLDMLWRIGFLRDDGTPFLQHIGDIEFQGPTWDGAAYYDDTVGFGANTPIVAIPGNWVHLAATFNRAGNMTFYVNGLLTGAIAINANNLGSRRFYALTGYGNFAPWYDSDFANWGSFSQCRGVVGPVAAHSVLLSVAQIRESIRAKRVQNLGAASTILCWDWRLIERLDGDPVTWDTDENHVMHATRAGLQGRGLAVPQGAAGTIRVPDLSGNARHWVLPTAATYGSTTNAVTGVTDKARIAFLGDPFWST